MFALLGEGELGQVAEDLVGEPAAPGAVGELEAAVLLEGDAEELVGGDAGVAGDRGELARELTAG